MNTFLALILQTILTLVVSDKKGFAFDERTQFFIYGIYFIFLGTLFLIVFVRSLISRQMRHNVLQQKEPNHISPQINSHETLANKEFNECNNMLLLKINNDTGDKV